MSVKKLLVLGAAGIASVMATAALAGGPELVAPVPDYSGVYLEGNVGYAYTPWNVHIPGARFFFFDNTNHRNSNVNNSLGLGGAIGYQWSRFLGAEFGGFWLGNNNRVISANNFVCVSATTCIFTGQGRRLNDWFLYLAAKVMAPVPFFNMDNFDLFFKAGVAYRQFNVGSFNFDNTNNGNSRGTAAPVFAAGLQYYFNPNWYVTGQYMYVGDVGRRLNFNFVNPFVPGVVHALQGNVPPIHLFTLGVGYKFQL